MKKGSPEAIVSANYKALWARYPDIAKRLQPISIGPESRYEIIRPDKSVALPTVLIKDVGKVYYNVADPFEDAKKNIELLNLKNTRIALFLGMGLGYELVYYLAHKAMTQKTFSILVIERDIELFKHAMHTVDITQIINNPKITLLVGLEESELFIPFRNFLVEGSQFMLTKACNCVYHQAAMHLHSDYYKRAIQIFQDTIRFQLANFGNDPYDSFLGIDNKLANLDTILHNPGINMLFDKFKGKPAVIVATGPSLDKNKELLKGLEDKALIIAVDAAMKIIYPMGIKPHLYTSLERVEFVVKLFDNMPDDAYEDSWLAACPVVLPVVYDTYKGPKIIVYRNFDHFKWMPIDRGIVDSKFSAGNLAFRIAQMLGCDPVILVGQDLSFKKDLSQSHAKGSSLGDLQEDFYSEGILQVKGNYDEEVPTSRTFYNCIKGYEVDLQGWNGTCINATEGGAYINGTKVMTLKEAIVKYLQVPNVDYRQLIKNELKDFQNTDFEADKKKLKDLIESTINEFNIMLKEAHEAIALVDEKESWLKGIVDGSDTSFSTTALMELEGNVTKPKYSWHKRFFNTFQLFFMHVFQSQHIMIEMDIVALPGMYDTQEKAVADALLHHRLYYKKFDELANVCLKRLEQSRIELP